MFLTKSIVFVSRYESPSVYFNSFPEQRNFTHAGLKIFKLW